MKKIAIIILTLTSAVFYGQYKKPCSDVDYKSICSEATKLVLTKLNSLTSSAENNVIEFRVYGNDSVQSEKFIQYTKLYDIATDAELISVIESCSSELSPAIRGYAYMAYAFRCDKEKRKEDPLTKYKLGFFVNVQNGYNLQNDMSFADFKSFCRLGDKYCPHIKEQLINSDDSKDKKKRKG